MLPILDHYEFLREIGKGSFARVYEAKHIITQRSVAIKVLNKYDPNDDRHEERIRHELAILKRLDHLLACELYDIIDIEDYICIVMEYVRGTNIRDFVNTNGKITEQKAKKLFTEMVLVLKYLHQDIMIAHRDLKAENVMIDQYGFIRIIDFGLSKALQTTNEVIQTACGSPAYAAPEMVRGESYSLSADIWSAGILLFAMCAGQLPYEDENIQKLIKKIIYMVPVYPEFFSRDLKDLICSLLTKDPKERINVNRVLSHQWIEPVRKTLPQEFYRTNVVDQEIVNQCSNFGFSHNLIMEGITKNLNSQEAITYKILHREKKLSILVSEISKKEKIIQNSSLSYGWQSTISKNPPPFRMNSFTDPQESVLTKPGRSFQLSSLKVNKRKAMPNHKPVLTFQD